MIAAATASSVSEWRRSFVAAIAITRTKMRIVHVMPITTAVKPDSQFGARAAALLAIEGLRLKALRQRGRCMNIRRLVAIGLKAKGK
jgi:hypothetical protein